MIVIAGNKVERGVRRGGTVRERREGKGREGKQKHTSWITVSPEFLQVWIERKQRTEEDTTTCSQWSIFRLLWGPACALNRQGEVREEASKAAKHWKAQD